ncbi:MAG TPA: hypothetical protein VGH53_23865 [Streptosporangiaceae bacterium]|jgi:hypothetical protein
MTPGELSRIEGTLRRAYGDVLESVRREGSSPELMPGFQPGRPGRGFGRPGRAGFSRRLVPVAAAAAVAVIALVSGLIVPGALRPAAAPAVHLGYAGTTRAPQYFNPLRPYARFGWLPPKSPSFPAGSEVISQKWMSLGNPSGAFLALYAAGACHLTGHRLNCPPSGNRYPLGRNIAHGDGHPAYWTAPQKARSPSGTSSTWSPLGGTSPGVLAWQYAAGGWAVLDYAASGHASARNDAVKIADHVRFGYRGEPAIRFPVQLTGVPANWQVNCVATRLIGHVMYAESDVVTAGRVTGSSCGDNAPQNAPHFDAGPGAKNQCGGFLYAGVQSKREAINGYQVVLITQKTWPNHELCADNAAGTFVWIATGTHPTLSPASIFTHHLRLLGSNPAKWTTKPIA